MELVCGIPDSLPWMRNYFGGVPARALCLSRRGTVRPDSGNNRLRSDLRFCNSISDLAAGAVGGWGVVPRGPTGLLVRAGHFVDRSAPGYFLLQYRDRQKPEGHDSRLRTVRWDDPDGCCAAGAPGTRVSRDLELAPADFLRCRTRDLGSGVVVLSRRSRAQFG